MMNLLFSCLSLLMAFVNKSTQVELPVIISEQLITFSKTDSSLQVFMMESLCIKIIPLCYGLSLISFAFYTYKEQLKKNY